MPASSKESSRNGLSGSASARPEPASCSRSGLGVGTADGRAVSWAAAGWRLAAAGLGGGWAVAGSCARVCRTHRNFLECGAPCGSQRHPSSAGRLEMSRTLSLSLPSVSVTQRRRETGNRYWARVRTPVCGAGWGVARAPASGGAWRGHTHAGALERPFTSAVYGSSAAGWPRPGALSVWHFFAARVRFRFRAVPSACSSPPIRHNQPDKTCNRARHAMRLFVVLLSVLSCSALVLPVHTPRTVASFSSARAGPATMGFEDSLATMIDSVSAFFAKSGATKKPPVRGPAHSECRLKPRT